MGIDIPQKSRGFTLIELVVTILVGGIMAAGIASYIADSVDGFAAAGNRNKLSAAGRTVVDRLAMELHNALPNSVRTSLVSDGDQCIEFIPVVAATTYLDAPFDDTGEEIEAIQFNPELVADPETDWFAVIYPIEISDLYNEDLRQEGGPGPRALLESPPGAPADDQVTLTLDEAHQFTRRSPAQRLYVTSSPVSFCVVDDRLFRYQDYGFQSDPPGPDDLPDAPQRTLVSHWINNAGLPPFSVERADLRRNSMISLEFIFSQQGDIVRLKHEVLMRNVP